MTEEKNSAGISRTTFAVGLIIALLLSTIISTLVTLQWAKGPKGDKGDVGSQGVEGPQGERGTPGSNITFAEWAVSWRTITGDLEWGAEVGTSNFCSVFDYTWGQGVIFGSYDDYIGFRATMQIRVQRGGPVSFTIGSDDGAKLYIDGIVKIDNWYSGAYRTKTITLTLSEGIHTLTLWYYDLTNWARVSFNCDSDITRWFD